MTTMPWPSRSTTADAPSCGFMAKLSSRRMCTALEYPVSMRRAFSFVIAAGAAAVVPMSCAGDGSGGGHDCEPSPTLVCAEPVGYTSQVSGDADDCALWVHSLDSSLSLVIGTDKATSGGLYVWDLTGQELQRIPLARPNNVDVRQGVLVDSVMLDLAVASLRGNGGLKAFAVDPSSRLLADVTADGGLEVPEVDDPYGLCLYSRPGDGALFAFVTSRSGDSAEAVHQYLLEGDGGGRVRGSFVRTLGVGAIGSLVEGLVADDVAGHIYAAEENVAVHKFFADPAVGLNQPIASFATDDGISGDREGLAVYACSDGTGYILLSSQGNSSLKVYPREGSGDDPDSHPLILTVKTLGATSSDGIDATSASLGASFPQGLVVKHHSPGGNFALFAWEDVAGGIVAGCPP